MEQELHGTFTKDKNNLTPGESYRGRWQERGVIQMEVHISHHHGHHLSTGQAYCKNGGRSDDI